MRRILFLVRLALGLVAAAVYVWYAAVRALPLVKRRKRARRAARR